MIPLQEAVERYPAYGFSKLFKILRRWGGHSWNHKRVYRVYCELNLNKRRRGKKRLPSRYPGPLAVPAAANGITQPIRFQGQWADEETGLYYNRHRYYDPDMGRYITSDPIGLAGGLNGYGYSKCNPKNNTDSTGLLPDCQVHQVFPPEITEKIWFEQVPFSSGSKYYWNYEGVNLGVGPVNPRSPRLGLGTNSNIQVYKQDYEVCYQNKYMKEITIQKTEHLCTEMIRKTPGMCSKGDELWEKIVTTEDITEGEATLISSKLLRHKFNPSRITHPNIGVLLPL